ncbi:MAG: IS1634 family transposase [Candidatus Berkelbacteria bacterium]
MYIREVKTGKQLNNVSYVSHRLVESIQTDKGPRQRTIMHLGTLSLPKSDWKILAAILEQRILGQQQLFEGIDADITGIADQLLRSFEYQKLHTDKTVVTPPVEDVVTADLNTVTISDNRSLGAELVAHGTWSRLGIDQILSECGFNVKQQALAQAVVVGRLINPGSELSTINWLKKQSSLIEFFEEDISKTGKDAFYEIADKLLVKREQIEQKLFANTRRLFPNDSTLFLFDLTNTYFEGQSSNNDLAKFGRSKEKRSDCRLVTLALMVDNTGMPVFSQIYGGNQSEPATLADVLGKIQAESTLYPELRPTIVMDRGIATRENIALVLAKEFNYVVIERSQAAKNYVDEITNFPEKFETIETAGGKKVFLQRLPVDVGARVLCISEERRLKERAIDKLRETRLIDDLKRLSESVVKGNVALLEKVARRVGRLQEKYSSVAQYYDIAIKPDEDNNKAKSISWIKLPAGETKNQITGAYVIETNLQDLPNDKIWRTYHTLTEVESAFRSLKTDLGMRPVHHQLARRTEGHLFISVLAYYLLASIEKQLLQAGDTRRWSTIKSVLSTHQRQTVSLTDVEKQRHSIRLSSVAESSHKEIYDKLKISDPLKRKKTVVTNK